MMLQTAGQVKPVIVPGKNGLASESKTLRRKARVHPHFESLFFQSVAG